MEPRRRAHLEPVPPPLDHIPSTQDPGTLCPDGPKPTCRTWEGLLRSIS